MNQETSFKGRKTRRLQFRMMKIGMMKMVSPLTSQVEALIQENSEKAEAITALQKRLAQVETELEAQRTETQSHTGNGYRVPQSLAELRPPRQPPAGMTAMQAIMGKLEIEESPEELLAIMKTLD